WEEAGWLATQQMAKVQDQKHDCDRRARVRQSAQQNVFKRLEGNSRSRDRCGCLGLRRCRRGRGLPAAYGSPLQGGRPPTHRGRREDRALAGHNGPSSSSAAGLPDLQYVADVHEVREALHGKAARVGTDLVGIQVSNELADAQSFVRRPGKQGGGVAARQPAPRALDATLGSPCGSFLEVLALGMRALPPRRTVHSLPLPPATTMLSMTFPHDFHHSFSNRLPRSARFLNMPRLTCREWRVEGPVGGGGAGAAISGARAPARRAARADR
ncbi:unnamed protein product, partial [Prorocentrum cordatum]